LNWVWWFNEVRLHGEIGYVPPVEFENSYYRQMNTQPQQRLGEPSLH
jgi:putative transposase